MRINLRDAHAALPKLAAAAVICLCAGANTRVDAANTSAAFRVAMPASLTSSMQVLAPRESELYETIFTAQAKSDWTTADRAISQLADKRLLGHVLADRYERRPASPRELQEWLTSYAGLSEAADLYEKARLLDKNSKIDQADIASPWSGNDGYGGSSGFRAEMVGIGKPAARAFAAKINHALRRNDPLTAEVLLENERHRRAVPADEAASAQALIAASFYRSGLSQHALHLTDAIAKEQNPLALWIGGLSAWKQNDMKAAGTSFATLAAQPDLSAWDSAAAAFWAYRALSRAGNNDAAQYWLTLAAQKPHSFYGLLAANVLGRRPGWSWELPRLNAHHIEILAQEKGGWRALALLQVGQRELAQNELRYLNPQGRRDLQEAMLALAETEHMPSLALQLGGVATRPDGTPYDAALYPVPPWQPEQGFAVDRALVYALMRHESQFEPEAVSGRGACGLMQLMPSTASLMSDGSIAGRDCSAKLLDPATNMDLGQKYVMHLAAQPAIGDNLLLLLAAYNGGPNKLGRWLHDNGDRDPLLFLESVPVRETHDYVQQVLVHYWIYRARLAEPQTSLTQLAEGKWPRYSLNETFAPRFGGTRQAALPQAMVSGSIELASYQR